jgi:hypothetical protein
MARLARVLLLFAALLPALLAQKANEDYSTPEKRAAQAVSLSDPDAPNGCARRPSRTHSTCSPA